MSVLARRWARGARVRVRRWGAPVAAVFLAAVVVPPLALAATDSAHTAGRAVAQVILYGAWVLALLLGSGGSGAQLRSGTALLWLQKPVQGALHHLDAVVSRLAVTALAILVLTGLGVAQATLLGPAGAPADAWAVGTTMLLMATVLVCMMHGFSGLGLPHEALFAVLAFFALTMLGWQVSQSAGGGTVLLGLAKAVSFPLDAVGYGGSFLAGRPVDDPLRHLAEVLLYSAGWVATGTVGALFSTRSPLPKSRD